jgi:tetratricopeptide (TPR) repeat protein
VLVGDPVERMRLRLALARFYEGQGAGAAAAQTIDSLYRENPAILGVVRAAVDYHWRNKNRKRAIDVLEEAAGRAASEYRPRFTLEAARKSTESGDYPRARTFAAKLIAADPDNAEYVAAMGDAYARAGDDRGLRAFYEGRLRAVAGRVEQASAMRRALIPVLTRMKDYSGAVDLYIEILNKFPEDEALTREAASYAASNGVGPKLRDYYAKATTDSPKDYRWPMVLARIETQREDYSAAITAYSKASEVRPDRADLIAARLNLEERLLRFDAVATSATKLYELSYRDPRWMEKLAEVRARQGQTAAAVQAITKAWIEGRPDVASNFFSAAAKLEQWGMLAEARKFAEEGLKRPVGDPAEAINHRRSYTRILVRLHDYDAGLAQFTGLNAATAAAVAQSFGAAVATFASVEDKAKIVTMIERHPRRIEIAQSAGLAEPEARWRALRMQASPTAPIAGRDRQRLIELQHARLRYADLAQQMEAFDRALPPNVARSGELEEAAAAFRAAGNTAAELRVLDRLHKRSPLSGPLFDRYCRLLMVQPQRLVSQITAEGRKDAADGMINYVLQHGSFAQSQQAIAAHGGVAGPLWVNAYTALAGLYFASTSPVPAVRDAFNALLGDMTIGSRIARPVDRDRQLAGDVWFYYGSRYGEYLAAAKQSGAEDYLPAMVEGTPGRSESYFTLAEDFADAGNLTAAAADYRYALELNPARADVHDRLAVLASKAGRNDEAIAEWKLAIAAFARLMDRPRVPGRFWTDLADTLRHIGEAKALPSVRDDVEKLLRTYIRRNGNYQVDVLLEAAVAASADVAAGVSWIADLSRSAANPTQFVSALIDRPWIPDAQRDVLYARIVEASDLRVSQTFGDQRENAQQEAWSRRIEWAKFLVDQRQNDRARTVLAVLSEEARKSRGSEIVGLDVLLAARGGNLTALLARYLEPPPVEELRRAATDLRKSGDAASSRRVLEFIYARDLRMGKLDAATFLGLAEIRLEEKDVPGAMALLRRMILVSGEPFSALDPAAALLQKKGHTAEAAEFLDTLVKAEPWNTEARTRLVIVRGGAAPPAPAKPTGDAAARERAWLTLIANEPSNRSAKVEAFRAALEARHDELATAIARELLPPNLRETLEYDQWIADSFLSDLSQADRVAIARGLGTAYQRMNVLARAAVFYQIAQRLEPADGIARSLATVKSQIQLAVWNEARRPLVTAALEQDRLVKPRITR